MIRTIRFVALGMCLAAAPLAAQEAGTASGKGIIERLVPPKSPGGEAGSEMVSFAPRFSHAYREGSGANTFTWIVLTEKEPPVKEWASARDRAEARRLWCQKEKASFVAVKLDAQSRVELYFLCPANGSVNTEMLNTVNGLDSVVVRFAPDGGQRLKGTLRTGQGNCPSAGGADAYCTSTGDYAFDAPLPR